MEIKKRKFNFKSLLLNKKASVWGLEISAKAILIILAAILFLIGVSMVLIPRLEGAGNFLKSLFRFGRLIQVLI